MARGWPLSIEGFVRQALGHDVLRLLEQEPAAARYSAEGIHHMRTSTRRLRSNLRFLGPLLDPRWSRELRAEMKWLAERLGRARDLDVLEEHLSAELEAERALPRREGEINLEEEPAALLAWLEQQRHLARAELSDCLESERYGALRTRLIQAARAPELASGGEESASRHLPRLLRRAWERFMRHFRRVDADASVAELHELRKEAKRARYSAEISALASSSRIRAQARGMADQAALLQDILGSLQDAVVERDFLLSSLNRGEGLDAPPPAIRRLLDHLEVKQREARVEFARHREKIARSFSRS